MRMLNRGEPGINSRSTLSWGTNYQDFPYVRCVPCGSSSRLEAVEDLTLLHPRRQIRRLHLLVRLERLMDPRIFREEIDVVVRLYM